MLRLKTQLMHESINKRDCINAVFFQLSTDTRHLYSVRAKIRENGVTLGWQLVRRIINSVCDNMHLILRSYAYGPSSDLCPSIPTGQFALHLNILSSV